MSNRFWLASISDVDGPAAMTFRRLIMLEKVFAVLPSLPISSMIIPGDLICFYLKGEGIAGYAQVATYPVNQKDRRIPKSDKYCSVFELHNPMECARPIYDFRDKMKREELDAFRGNRYSSWAWFVRTPHEITEYDFCILTGIGSAPQDYMVLSSA